MEKKFFSLTTQIRICMVFILLLVLVSGVIALRDVDVLWKQTNDIYNHPLTVRRSLGNIQNEVNSIQTNFQRIITKENTEDRRKIIQSIEDSEDVVYEEFVIVGRNFLGSPELVKNAEDNFSMWKEKRDEKINFLLQGNVITDFEGNKESTGNDASCSVDELRKSLTAMSDFADAKGDALFENAKREKSHLTVNFILILIFLLVLIFCILLYLLKTIQLPLNQITTATDNFRRGIYDTRCSYSSNNEFGKLALAFNNLAGKIQVELVNRGNVRNITDAVLKDVDVDVFIVNLLTVLMEKTKSQMGCLHLRNEDKKEFDAVKSIGVSAEDCRHIPLDDIDGEFGLAISTRKVQYVENIPVTSFISLKTLHGKIKPKEMIIIPVFSGDKPVAVVSLANIHVYSGDVIRLIEDSKSIVNARINNIISYEQINRFSKEISMQNEELKIQKEELKVQAIEQNKQSIALEVQQKELIAANRLKSSFLSNMSHELRTPLNSVIALSKVLIRKTRDIISSKELEYLEVIQRNGKHLLSLINDILNISRIESGKEEITSSTFSIRGLVNDTIEMILPQATEKNISINNTIPDGLQNIQSDVRKCQHILQNLIGNAVKFTEEGHVDISAYIKDRFIYVVVTDTGVGIEKSQLKYVFDEFRQIDDSTTKQFEGTGLGLAIAKKYAVLLKGDISVTSTVGKGTEFTLKLPLLEETERHTSSDEQEIRSKSKNAAFQNVSLNKSEKTILIVDDSEPAIIQLTDMLKEDDYKIVVARDGVEALSRIKETKPNAVVLDLMMPRIDGFQVLKTLRGDQKTAHLPVLVLTAKYITNKELDFLNGNGIYQLIQKGDVSKKQLLTVIGGMLKSEVHNGE